MDAFYQEMGKFYSKPAKHESPTRRLRQQIETAFTQKEFLSKQPDYQANKSQYGITYVVGVSDTYVVQPQKGELPYELAEKKPLAFYREVMEGNVKEHHVNKSPKRRPSSSGYGALPSRKTKKKRPLQYNQAIKKRSVAYILGAVQNKLKRMISTVTDHSPEAIERALSNPEAEQLLQRRITDKSIQLVDQRSGNPVFTRQMSKIGEQGYRAAQQSPNASEMDASILGGPEPEEAELVSETILMAQKLNHLTACVF